MRKYMMKKRTKNDLGVVDPKIRGAPTLEHPTTIIIHTQVDNHPHKPTSSRRHDNNLT
jgi:hypothetical protein